MWSFAFDDTGQRMATVSDDSTVRFWKDANGLSSTTVKYEEVQTRNPKPVYRSPKPETRNPKPETQHLTPYTPYVTEE